MENIWHLYTSCASRKFGAITIHSATLLSLVLFRAALNVAPAVMKLFAPVMKNVTPFHPRFN